jgi:predicted MPP superfamily phosphohydrolase
MVKRDVPIRGLPKTLEGFTIGVMADFHAGAFATKEDIRRVVRMVNREKPDIVALLGDYIDGAYSHSPKNVKKGAFVFDALKGLKAPLGVYAVLGNHDHWTDAAQVRQALSRVPVDVLDNQALRLPHGLALAGVDDYWEGPSEPSEAMRSLGGESLIILLSHNPDVNLLLGKDKEVKLVLSGHTHGGQFRVPLLNRAPWVPCSPKYRGTSGLIQETPHRWTFITKGVGTFFVPRRLFRRPDVGILRLISV